MTGICTEKQFFVCFQGTLVSHKPKGQNGNRERHCRAYDKQKSDGTLNWNRFLITQNKRNGVVCDWIAVWNATSV